MPAEPALDADEFSAAVSAVTSAFGDPTRRDIYLAIRETPAGVTAAEVAERFALHPNVARHHLEKLSAGGYVTVDVDRVDGARAAGRPSKRYRIAEQDTVLIVPAARDDLLATLLARARRAPARPGRGHGRRGGLRLRQDPRRAHGTERGPPVGEGRARDRRRGAHRARLRGARRVERRVADHRLRALPVRCRRAALPARGVRGRPRPDPRPDVGPLRRHATDLRSEPARRRRPLRRTRL